MKTDCPFLKLLHRPQGGSTHVCGAGVNFYPVGKDRELCRACSVASLGRLPDCGHLDGFAWLEGRPGGAPFVCVDLYCDLTGDPLPNLLQCAGCPERLPQSAGVAQLAMAHAISG